MKSSKNIFRFFMLVFAAIVFGACQRVIHVDLNSSASQVVIQAYVTDQPNIDTVLITKTAILCPELTLK